MAFQNKQHMNVIVCHIFFSGLIHMFILNILQIPNGFKEIFSECIAPTCTFPYTGLISVSVVVNSNMIYTGSLFYHSSIC